MILDTLVYFLCFIFLLTTTTNIMNNFKIKIPNSGIKILNKLSIYLFNIFKFIILFYIFINIFSFVTGIFSYLSQIFGVDLVSYVIPNGESTDLPNKVDPVRWWPSGVPQSISIVGTGLATFMALSKMPGISPRLRVLGALGVSGVSASTITYHSAIENSVGFNRLMWSYSEYKRTGSWPSIDTVNNVSKTTMDSFVSEALKSANQSAVDTAVKDVVEKSANKFLPSLDLDISSLITKFIDLIFKETMQLLNPVYVEGFFDDLIGQRMFIEVILLILAISIVFLFIVFIFNVIFLLNKDRIIKKFNNKFISLYVNYQAFLSKLTLFYLPVLIFIGLFGLCHALYWLITNQIPYESLDIDLHQYISFKKK